MSERDRHRTSHCTSVPTGQTDDAAEASCGRPAAAPSSPGRRCRSRRSLRRAGSGPAASAARLGEPHRTPAGALEWANWPLYIDIDDDGNYPSLVAFTEESGLEVNYTEAIQDNADFMGMILPDLQAGNATGWDIITPGGWVVERLARLEVLEELDHSQLPNWTANAADYAKGLWFDPENRYSLWWQGGITGLAYDPSSPAARSRPSTTCSTRPLPGSRAHSATCATRSGSRCCPSAWSRQNATVDDVTRARDKLLEANGRNQFRGYYGNEYYDALAAGDLAISIAWSGDITQMQLNDNDKVQFVIPQDGAMRWNDNFAIPKGTARIHGAHKLMNYYYGVPGATLISEYIGYFTGVNGVQEQIVADAEAYRADGDTEECGLLRRRGADGRADRGPAREHVHRQGAHRR